MHYDKLKEILERLEQSIPVTIPPDRRIRELIRNEKNRSSVQAYGLSKETKETKGKNYPIVIAVGINYTQAPAGCPRDSSLDGFFAVEDSLKTCRRNMKRALENYNSRPECWSDTKNASNNDITGFNDFHFVATNFCLWITQKKWAEIDTEGQELLLQNNPLFDQKISAEPDWPHLKALVDKLAGEKVLWVPHGLRNQVFPLFRKFSKHLGRCDWLRTSNLSYLYRYGVWPHPRSYEEN